MTTPAPLLQIEFGLPSFCFGTSSTQVCLTRATGMMGPVRFFADSAAPVQPYLIAPWWNEGVEPGTPAMIGALRGDFFCAPFGGNNEPFNGRTYPAHGESPNSPWTLERVEQTAAGAALHLVQQQTVQPGTIRKALAVREGENVIYSRNLLEGMQGPMCLGHHPNMYLPDSAGQAILSFAPRRHAHTYIHPTERPEERGYSFLRPDSPIEDLRACPTITGATTDLTRYPARRGFEDIVMLCAQPDLPFGWTAFAVPSLGYVWFSLKDPRVLPSTLLWMSNGGRHMPPWSSRNINCIGLEEIVGFFHEGLAASARPNFINQMGIPTVADLDPANPLSVNFIQGVARIPHDFTGVESVESVAGGVELRDGDGHTVAVPVELGFLKSGTLADLI